MFSTILLHKLLQSMQEDRVDKYGVCQDWTSTVVGLFKTVVTMEMGILLKDRILNMEPRLFGLKFADIRQLAF